jgi:hypothetical protein
MLNVLMSASLVYGAFLLWNCPCKTPCRCKYPQFMASVGVPLAYVVLQNALAETL